MKRWHSLMVEALKETGERYGYAVLKPSVIYLRFVDGPSLVYMPDCVWTYGRSAPSIVIFEVETNPSPKIVAGEVALASMCGTRRALILPYDHELGEDFREPIVVPDVYDSRRRRKILPGTRVRLPQAERVTFMLILKDEECYDHYKRYVDVIARQRGLFYYYGVTWSDARSHSGAMRALSHDDEIRWWLE